MKEATKDYATPEEFLSDCEATLKLGGMMLMLPENTAGREPLKVHVTIGKKPLAEFQAEAVYSSPQGDQFQVGIQFQGDWQKLLNEAKEKITKLGETGQKWGKDSESIYHQVQNMETHQKIQLAIKGNREERRVLMKDTHYMVHPYVLKNPRITSEEVSHFAKMPSITSEMMKTITENHEWMSNMAVRSAVVKNPKTPVPIVQKHIGQLQDNELMQIAKSGSVRDAVAKLAVKVLASRGKHVR